MNAQNSQVVKLHWFEHFHRHIVGWTFGQKCHKNMTQLHTWVLNTWNIELNLFCFCFSADHSFIIIVIIFSCGGNLLIKLCTHGMYMWIWINGYAVFILNLIRLRKCVQINFWCTKLKCWLCFVHILYRENKNAFHSYEKPVLPHTRARQIFVICE